jgi:hypothetical protein
MRWKLARQEGGIASLSERLSEAQGRNLAQIIKESSLYPWCPVSCGGGSPERAVPD